MKKYREIKTIISQAGNIIFPSWECFVLRLGTCSAIKAA